jgi:GH15 family glucan-1,4-alpha-glucosidase
MKKRAEELYKESIKVLKSVQLKNGGCLATPLGLRYPYVYPRDHGFCVLAFISAGMLKEAKKALEFILKAQLINGAFPQRLDENGKDASYKPIQLDGTALTLYTFCRYIKASNDLEFAKEYWKTAQKTASYIEQQFYGDENLVYTPNSIHEFPPTEQGLEIWANCVCYAALKELDEIGKLLKSPISYGELANKIKAGIEKNMWNSRIKSFVKNIRIKESSSVKLDPDVAECGVYYFNILENKDEKVRLTIKRIEKELWHKKLGGICRYPKREGRHNGGYGPWPHFTLMISQHYIRLKNKRKSDKYINWILKIAYKNKLPEHLSTAKDFNEYVQDFSEAGLLRKDRMIMIENAKKNPMFKKGIAYIILPLAWPHAEFILTWNLYKEVFKVK